MNLKQQTFVTEYLRHRSAYTAYCLAYHPKDAGNYDSIMSAANRLLNHPEINGLIRSVLEGIRCDVEQEIRAELKTELLTIQSKRELLAKIARGEMTAVQHYKGKDCNHCTQMVMPTINQMLRAIDLDNKMAGLYGPPKAQAGHSPQTITAPAAHIEQQVDKLIASMGITTDVPHAIGNAIDQTYLSEQKHEESITTQTNRITKESGGTVSTNVFPTKENVADRQQNTTTRQPFAGLNTKKQQIPQELCPPGAAG